MNKAVGIALVIVGILMLVFGFSAAESIGSEFSRLFTGAPTDRAIWLILGGVAAMVVGLVMLPRRDRLVEPPPAR